jgi:hypothetical protein
MERKKTIHNIIKAGVRIFFSSHYELQFAIYRLLPPQMKRGNSAFRSTYPGHDGQSTGCDDDSRRCRHFENAVVFPKSTAGQTIQGMVLEVN